MEEYEIENFCLACKEPILKEKEASLHQMMVHILGQEPFEAMVLVCWHCKQDLDRDTGPAIEAIINARLTRAANPDTNYHPRPGNDGNGLAEGQNPT